MAWKIVLVLAVFLLTPLSVRAEYVLPYPSYMPGNKLYRVSRFLDRAKKPFYFGNINRFKYHLKLADKYLVEAKTLFEYKQYLLGVDALKRSDAEFTNTPQYLKRAKAEGKDIRAFQTQLVEASAIHQEIVTMLLHVLPEKFTWTPEKSRPTELSLTSLLSESLRIRQSL